MAYEKLVFLKDDEGKNQLALVKEAIVLASTESMPIFS